MHPIIRVVLQFFIVLLALATGIIISSALSQPITRVFIDLYTRYYLWFGIFWISSIAAAFLLAKYIPFATRSMQAIVLSSGLLSGILVIVYTSHVPALNRGAQKGTLEEMRAIGISLESYRKRHGSYPSAGNIDSLENQLQTTLPHKDAWGTPYLFSSTVSTYFIVSFGNDGKKDKIEPVGATIEFSQDIVFKNGAFTAYPEGVR